MKPRTAPFLTEGRRLMQRMLTLHVARKHDEAALEIMNVKDIRVIMSALNVATAGMAAMIHSSHPEPADRESYLADVMLSLEQQG